MVNKQRHHPSGINCWSKYQFFLEEWPFLRVQCTFPTTCTAHCELFRSLAAQSSKHVKRWREGVSPKNGTNRLIFSEFWLMKEEMAADQRSGINFLTKYRHIPSTPEIGTWSDERHGCVYFVEFPCSWTSTIKHQIIMSPSRPNRPGDVRWVTSWHRIQMGCEVPPHVSIVAGVSGVSRFRGSGFRGGQRSTDEWLYVI